MPSASPGLFHKEKSIIPTKVEPFATTNFAFSKPTKAKNNPMPGPIASLITAGIARTTASRNPTTVIIINKIPEINTVASASPYVYPMVKITVNAKNAFNPIPGAWAKGTFAYTAIRNVPKKDIKQVAKKTPFCTWPA